MRARLALVVLLACSSAAAADPVARIPFELVGSHTFIEVRIGGESLSFVFDTGASNMALNLATARRLGLEATGRGTATGAGGTTTASMVSGLEIDVGSLRLSGVGAGLLPLDHLEERVGRPLDGIIGGPIMKGRVVIIDYDREVLEVHAKRSFPFASWGAPCRLEGSLAQPLVRAEVRLPSGDVLRGRLVVDSGAALFVAFSTPFVERHDLVGRVGATYSRTGRALTGRPIVSRVGRVAGVRFCGYEFPPSELGESEAMPVVLSGATAGVLAMDGLAGLLGNEVLRRFNVALDLDHKSLYLRPNGHWRDPIRTDASGLELIRERDGTVRIEGVIIPSPAAEAGLEKGDAVRSVNGAVASAMTLPAVRDHLREAGRTVELEVSRNGKMVTVPLALRTLGSP